MKTIKGPAIFLAQFAGDAAPFNSLDGHRRLGGGARLQGHPDPDLGRPALRPQEGGVEQDLLRRGQGDRRRTHGLAITELSTHLQGQLVAVQSGLRRGLRRLRGAGGARQPEGAHQVGGRPGEDGAPRPAATSASTRMVTFTGALAWPFLYPWPQRPAGLIETAFDELAQALEADLRLLRRAGRRRRLRAPSRRGPARRRHLRDVPRARRQPSALRHQLRPLALRAAVPRLSRVHRHLSRADLRLPRQGRRVQPDRPAGRLLAASSAG